MTSREKAIKAVAGALQPEALDLTKYVKRSIRDGRQLKLRKEDAAGVLAFDSMDQYEGLDGKPCAPDAPGAVRLRGDKLAPVLLRLKYANQHSRELFTKGHLLLLARMGWEPRRPSETMYAIAFCAIFEWVHDQCPECRGVKPKPLTEVCGNCVNGRRVPEGERWSPRHPKCQTCRGEGRIFKEAKKGGIAMQCSACNNSGRREFENKQRWQIVAEYLADAAKLRGWQNPPEFKYDSFRIHWLPRYRRFLDILRAADKTIAAGLDLGLRASHNRQIGPLHQEQDTEEADEPGDQTAAG